MVWPLKNPDSSASSSPDARSAAERVLDLEESYSLWIRRITEEQWARKFYVNPELVSSFAQMTLLRKEYDRRPIYRLTKRIFDWSCAAFLLTSLLPLLAACALAVKLSEKGPIFFRQLRVGEMGQIFWIYKFRTMHNGAERLQFLTIAPMSKTDKDPRSTRVGHLLRHYKLDELPQLLNVLLGEMSLVGPRPLTLDDSSTTAPEHLVRFAVKPGITGLWQATIPNTSPGLSKIRLDAEYVARRSWSLDLTLLLKTIPVVLKGEK